MLLEVNSTTAIKLGGWVSSSSLIADMVIFNDPIYSILSLMGAFLSFGGMLHESFKHKHKNPLRVSRMFSDLFRAVILGGILTPMFFMLFIHTGGTIVSLFVGLDGLNGIFNSFWWLLSLLSAWYSPLIWDWVLSIIKRKGNEYGQ